MPKLSKAGKGTLTGSPDQRMKSTSEPGGLRQRRATAKNSQNRMGTGNYTGTLSGK